jgi:UDP-GlcNAc:undecaprenyl-phosphate GlcNAc-1-phosphate transferase
MINEYYLIIAIFILSIVSNWFFNKYFSKHKLYDQITLRSSHSTKATRSGGVAIFTLIFLVSTFCYLKGLVIYDYSILIPLSLLFLIGLYDDIYQLDFKLKFIFQIIAAKIIIDNGLIIDNLHGFLEIFELDRISAQIFTIFIILSIINAINFIDGIDGLAVSIVVIFIFLFETTALSNSTYFYLNTLLIASLIPLLYFNYRNKNKVFLGDSGSLFIGGVVSVCTIYILTDDYLIKPKYDIHKLLFVVSVLIYPIFDLTRIVIKRLIEGKSPFIADKNHIHHKIQNLTNSHKITTSIISIISLIFFFIIQLLF